MLTYKTSRIFNLAQGAISTSSAYVFYYLFAQEHLPWPIAGLISVVGVGVVLGLLFEPLARKLSRSTLAARVVAMVGILIAVQAFFTILYGPTVRLFPSFLSNCSYAIGHANVSVTDIVICSLALCVTVALYVFFRTARLGVAMRGVVDDSDLLSLSGTSPKAVRRWAWILGCNLAAVAGVLLAPSLNLDAETLSLLVVEAFGAAAIGAFTSIPITYAGGLAIGVIGAIVTEYAPTSNIYLTGLSPSLPFIVLFIVMIAMPRRWLATTPVVIAKRSAWTAPAKTQLWRRSPSSPSCCSFRHSLDRNCCSGRWHRPTSSSFSRWGSSFVRRVRSPCVRSPSWRSDQPTLVTSVPLERVGRGPWRCCLPGSSWRPLGRFWRSQPFDWVGSTWRWPPLASVS